MLRRKFLQLSGFSAASLFFTGAHAESGASYQALNFPAEVSLLSAGRWIRLTGSKDRWTHDRLAVDLSHKDHFLNIQLRAPGAAVEKIKLSWQFASAAEARYLGDHWERSYGDLAWENSSPERKAPWYMLISDGGQTHAFGLRTGAGSIGYWQASPQQVELFLDTLSGGSGVQLGDRTLNAADIITTQSGPGETPFQTDARFCKMMCAKPKLPEKPVFGINDWYFAYGNNSRKLILETTGSMAELAHDTNNRPFSVIDDGWAFDLSAGDQGVIQGPDYTRSNENFGDMSTVASRIKEVGMRPGLWTRALRANKNDRPSLLIPLRSGESALGERYLDPTIPENLHRIGAIISLYRDWGFEMVKHDFSTYDFLGRWGSGMKQELTTPGWHLNDQSRTNAEILLELYTTIRQAAGNMLLIGCNTMSHLSAGIFELNRIGDDTRGQEWARTLKMGVNTIGFRLPQHNAFYAVDGDCVGLTTKIPWQKNKQWLQLLTESGAPLFVSAQPEAMGADQREAVRKSFDLAARPQPLGEPLDWLTNPRPASWKLNGRIVDFDWT